MHITPDTRIVFVCDKPSQARLISFEWKALHPRVPFLAVLACSKSLTGLPPRLPRDLPVSETPMIAAPLWATDDPPPVFDGTSYLEMDSGQLMRDADVVVCATSADARGAFAFRNLARHYLGDPGDRAHHPRLELVALDRSSIRSALRNPDSTSDAVFEARLAEGDAKRFFDANWAINALPLLGLAQAAAGVPASRRIVSKYALQLLYALDGVEASIQEGQVLRMLARWPGTGRYADAPERGLGSPASRPEIFEQLKRAGLIEMSGFVWEGDDAHSKGYRISPAGRDFLARLHPRCRDADLPFRLHAWGKTWPESRPSMETYLKTYFGRQRRYSSEGDSRVRA